MSVVFDRGGLLIALIFQKGHDIFIYFCLILTSGVLLKRGGVSRRDLFSIMAIDWNLAKKVRI